MDTFKSLLDRVNNKTKEKPIFFISNDPERALGLENYLKNYHIVCIDDNDIVEYMKNHKIKIFSLENETNQLNTIYRNSNRLLHHDLTKEYISKNTTNEAYFMFFKIAPNLERTAGNMNFEILNTSSKLNRKYELKLSQYETLKDIGVNFPRTLIIKLEEADYSELINELGENFIVQFNRGHTGGGTVEIINEQKLENLKRKFPERQVRCAKQIYGPSYTLNACNTRFGTVWGGLSYQITGLEECTSERLATVGNDWKFIENIDKKTLKQIDKMTKLIGEKMYSDGFLGMFGLDIVIDSETNIPYIIEINARQPASIPMFTKIQVLNKQIPLNLLSIAEFLKLDYKIDPSEYTAQASQAFKYAQLFIRNKYKRNAQVIGSVKAGAYRLVGDNSAYSWSHGDPKLKQNVIILDEDSDMPLILEEETYAIDRIQNAGMILLCAKEGKIVHNNAEVARIQASQSLISKSGKLKTWTQRVVNGLNKYIILKEIKNEGKIT